MVLILLCEVADHLLNIPCVRRGLMHGFVRDPLNFVDVEYGDNTEIMASARDTWEGLSYMVRHVDICPV